VDSAEERTIREKALDGNKKVTADEITITAKKLPKIPAATAAEEDDDESLTIELLIACCEVDAVTVAVAVAVIVWVLD
jgi:hypothetical protein